MGQIHPSIPTEVQLLCFREPVRSAVKLRTKDMITLTDVQPYDITNGEKVHYGHYAALEVVFNQFCNELESFFFDEFNTSFEFSYQIETGLKFRHFQERIKSPQPIVLFCLSPLIGDCLLLMENRSTNLLLARDRLMERKRTAISNRFVLTRDHQQEIQETIEPLLTRFCSCWERILPVSSKLKKLVTNKIKARVMSPAEACVIVKVSLKQNQFSTEWEFCFSDYQLDQVIKKHGAKLLLAGNGEARENESTRRYFTELLLSDSHYQISGCLGVLRVSEKELLESFEKQTVLPISSEISDNAIITINGKPLLSASIGMTNEKIALQVNSRYERKKVEEKGKKRSFSKIHFPKE